MVLQRELKGKRVILYPAYFDSRLSRSQGRRVPRELAVKAPSAEEVARAAREAGYDAFVEDGVRYPRVWWLSEGRVVVEKKGKSKTKIIREIAEIMVRRRSKG